MNKKYIKGIMEHGAPEGIKKLTSQELWEIILFINLINQNQQPTPEAFAEQMRRLDEKCDTEEGHEKADALMCDVLVSLGFFEGVQVFKQMAKWYA